MLFFPRMAQQSAPSRRSDGRLSLHPLVAVGPPLWNPCPTIYASVVFTCAPCRVGKYKQIREILEPVPERRFDPSTIRVPYVSGFGTAYVDAYEQVRRRGFDVSSWGAARLQNDQQDLRATVSYACFLSTVVRG